MDCVKSALCCQYSRLTHHPSIPVPPLTTIVHTISHSNSCAKFLTIFRESFPRFHSLSHYDYTKVDQTSVVPIHTDIIPRIRSAIPFRTGSTANTVERNHKVLICPTSSYQSTFPYPFKDQTITSFNCPRAQITLLIVWLFPSSGIDLIFFLLEIDSNHLDSLNL